MTDQGTSSSDNWLKRAEEALQRAGEAAAEAWKATEDVRGQAWETAKRAFNQAADALDQGIESAKAAWSEATSSDAADDGSAAVGDDPPAAD